MGYRLTIMNPETGEILNNSKFFGYVYYEDLQKSRSLRWLIDNHKLDDYEPEERSDSWIWDYGASHEMILRHSELLEFIVLYILDRNEFYCVNKDCYDRIEYYEEALKLPWVKVGWY